MCVCIVAPHSLKNRWAVVISHGLGFRLHTPKPGQNIGGKHGNPRAGCDAGQGLLSTRFAVRELVAADHDCDQTCHLGNRAGEERLHGGESGIERRLRQGKRRE